MTSNRGGPHPHRRIPADIKARQGLAVYELVWGKGLSYRKAAAHLGMSPTTAWRRSHWFADWMLPARYGRPDGPLPPQRGTAACPRGRPYMPTLDGPGGPFYRGGNA